MHEKSGLRFDGTGFVPRTVLGFALLTIAIPGCVSSSPSPKAGARPAYTVETSSGGTFSPAETPDEVLSTDTSAIRLHDISGALLLYCAVHKHLPQTLEEVQTTADSDMHLNFISPGSGKPYGYAPEGLQISGRPKRIIVFDPVPSSDGKRWCIFMADTRPGAARSVEVLSVPEAVFKMFKAAEN